MKAKGQTLVVYIRRWRHRLVRRLQISDFGGHQTKPSFSTYGNIEDENESLYNP